MGQKVVERSPDRLVVGRIVRPHGLRGELVVEVLSDAPNRFSDGAVLDAGDPAGERVSLTIAASRVDRGRLLVRFAEVPDRTAAERLHGSLLSIAGGEAATPAEGEYYAWQLEGLEVVDESGRRLGILSRVMERAGNDLWVVEGESGEALVPAVDEFIRRVDLEAGRVVVHVIPGLFD